jgi:hypothetical protein
MSRFFHNAVRSFTSFFGFVFDLTVDGLRFLCLTVRSRSALGAEVLFLRKQLAFYVVVVTARFRILYVFLLMELGTRRILHCNLTAHPTAEWTLQQFREAIPCDHPYRFLIRDRDSIFSVEVDDQLKAFGLRVLRTPARAPQANAYCERLVGTVRRECLDFMIPVREKHLSKILVEWVRHYNQGRPHSSLGPGIPEPVEMCLPQQPPAHGRRFSARNCKVTARAILGGLHHEYRWERVAA